MKIIKSSIFIGLLALIFAGCNKDNLADLNVDPKSPSDVSGEYLFSNAQQNLSDQIASTNVNLNVWKLWSQYWAECQYPDESQYNVTNRNVPTGVWSAFYRDVLIDFDRAKTLTNDQYTLEGLSPDEAEKAPFIRDNKLAITDILMVFTYQRLVDTFGNVPYSQALDLNTTTTPAYDDAETIYSKLFERLDADIAMLNPAYTSFTPSAEYIFNGDVASWITFANSLKFKMAVTVMDVPSLDPGGKAQAAISAGIIADPSQNAMYPYSTVVPNTNTLWEDLVASGRSDFVAANTVVDYMNALEDPRRPFYFDDNITDSTNAVVYSGGTYGATNSFSNYTHVSNTFKDPTYPNTLIDYTEMQFYLAEANASGLISTGNVEDYYNEGVAASIISWGGTQGDADTYLAQDSVAYSVVEGASGWRYAIGKQEWLAFYSRGFEGYSTWRRLDAPILNVPPNLGFSYADIPVRFNYPVEEQTLNGPNYTQAAAAIGGDSKTTKLFWDKY